jgi:hypothetical protein
MDTQRPRNVINPANWGPKSRASVAGESIDLVTKRAQNQGRRKKTD